MGLRLPTTFVACRPVERLASRKRCDFENAAILFQRPKKIAAISLRFSGDFSAISAVRLAICILRFANASDFLVIAIFWDAKVERISLSGSVFQAEGVHCYGLPPQPLAQEQRSGSTRFSCIVRSFEARLVFKATIGPKTWWTFRIFFIFFGLGRGKIKGQHD